MEDEIQQPKPYSEVLPVYGHHDLREFLHDATDLVANTEYETVRRGMRDVDRYHLTAKDYDTKIDRVMRDGLVFLPVYRIKAYNGFSHTHESVPELGIDTMVYGVVARDLDVAKSFVDANKAKPGVDHANIGEMLGYPECCRSSFDEFWKKSYDPIYEMAENTPGCEVDGNKITITGGNPRLYSHLRYFGLRIIPWFPCSYECEESIELSDKWLSVMRDINSELTDKVLELMSMPSSWDLLNAQIVVSHPHFMGRATSYYTEDHKIVMFE